MDFGSSSSIITRGNGSVMLYGVVVVLCCLLSLLQLVIKKYHYYLVVILSLFNCSLFRRRYRQYMRLTSGLVNVNILVILVISQMFFQTLRYSLFYDAEQGWGLN